MYKAIIFALVFAVIYAVHDGFMNRQLDVYRPYLKDFPEEKAKYAQDASDVWHLLGYFRNFVLIVTWVLLTGFNLQEVVIIFATFILVSDDIVSMTHGKGFETPCTVDSPRDINDWIFETIRKSGVHPFIVKVIFFIFSLYMDVIIKYVCKAFLFLWNII